MPSRAVALGAERLERAGEVGLGEAGVDPGAQVGAQGVEVVPLVREVRREALGGAGDRLDELA